LLIANRGEIALRIGRAAAELDIRSVCLVTPEDVSSLHAVAADEAVEVQSYLDVSAVVRAAVDTNCTMLHPGYGFLSERPELARLCDEAGIAFIGPTTETLATLGDKVAARALAQKLNIPVARASDAPCRSADEVRASVRSFGLQYPLMLKAVGGGGGRGIRPVHDEAALDEAFVACTREADLIDAVGGVFVEEMLQDARHIEVQLLGDGRGGLVHLLERDCSVQRRRQKLIEMSPALGLDEATRERIFAHTLAIGRACLYRSAGTCEFLVRPDGSEVFLECNPRIQVEHPVSEEATGVDIVRSQLQIASGASLADLGLGSQAMVRRHHAAIQARIQMVVPGRVAAYSEPGGMGIRVDGALYSGYTPPVTYDPLLAKLIARAPIPHGGDGGGRWRVESSAAELARRRLLRSCAEMHIGGSVRTNLEELARILESDAFKSGAWTTSMLDAEDEARHAAAGAAHESARKSSTHDGEGHGSSGSRAELLDGAMAPSRANPSNVAQPSNAPKAALEGCLLVLSPVNGQVIESGDAAKPGAELEPGQTILVVSSMKMEFVVKAPSAGTLVELLVPQGQLVHAQEPVALLRLAERSSQPQLPEVTGALDEAGEALDDPPRADLARVLERRALISDAGRAVADPKFSDKVSKRRQRGQRTARENVDALVDQGSFFEYGRFAVAAQRGRRSLDDLIKTTPADGLVCGVGSINEATFGPACSRAAVVAYDATVLAGTQGVFNHMKLDRMLHLAESQRLPLVLLAEGGGGRPGDVDVDPIINSMLAVPTFRSMGRLSGLVPTVGIASGYCFAGNAALLGSCDVVIATRGSNIGMAGPAMVEGGGLGKVPAHAIGPCAEQVTAGVVDLVASDESEACELAKRYLSFFQGALPRPAGGFGHADQQRLRAIVPLNRKRLYEVRDVIETLADEGSWLELRRGYALGVVSGLMRVNGQPLGVLANSPSHLGGALDSDGALKAARFMELCDAFELPLLLLCDTPGFMVGPESERTGAVRKMSRLFTVASSLTVPYFTIVLRKAYGLGAMAMSGGMSVGSNVFHASWPSAEAGPMGPEGAVELGFAKELAAAAAVPLVGKRARQALFDKLMSRGLERADAISVARTLETDDVIDPAESRDWIQHGLQSAAQAKGSPSQTAWRVRDSKRKRPCVSPW